MDTQILDKITGLFAKFEDEQDQNILKGWLDAARHALLIKALGENEVVKDIYKKIVSDIELVEYALLNADSGELPNNKRDVLLEVKRFYKWFVSFLTDATKSLEDLKKEVKESERKVAEMQE